MFTSSMRPKKVGHMLEVNIFSLNEQDMFQKTGRKSALCLNVSIKTKQAELGTKVSDNEEQQRCVLQLLRRVSRLRCELDVSPRGE